MEKSISSPAGSLQFDADYSNLDPAEWLFRKEAAEYLRVQPQTLAVWSCSGRYNLPYYKVGGRVRYRRSDLDRFRAEGKVRKLGIRGDQS